MVSEEKGVVLVTLVMIAFAVFSLFGAIFKHMNHGMALTIVVLPSVFILSFMVFTALSNRYKINSILKAVAIISLMLCSFVILDISGMVVSVHELGHYSVCKFSNLQPEPIKYSRYHMAVSCKGSTGMPLFVHLLFFAGGVIAEISFYSIFLISKYTRVYAGAGYLNVALDNLLGAYNTDTSLLIKYLPSASFLNTLYFRVLIVVIAIFILAFFIIKTLNLLSKE